MDMELHGLEEGRHEAIFEEKGRYNKTVKINSNINLSKAAGFPTSSSAWSSKYIFGVSGNIGERYETSSWISVWSGTARSTNCGGGVVPRSIKGGLLDLLEDDVSSMNARSWRSSRTLNFGRAFDRTVSRRWAEKSNGPYRWSSEISILSFKAELDVAVADAAFDLDRFGPSEIWKDNQVAFQNQPKSNWNLKSSNSVTCLISYLMFEFPTCHINIDSLVDLQF